MSERDIRERDILVAPNEYAYVQDLTKGDIVLYVGPTKISLSNTERMIVLLDGRFVPMRGEQAGLGVHKWIEASSAQYIVLENPPKDSAAQPTKGANSAIALLTGRTVVVHGPAQFPLWPGQEARVVSGHRLRQEEYLVVRAYDASAGDGVPIGTEKIIRGSDVSFFMPTTGWEVVQGADGRYVRRAWRLDTSRGLHVRVNAAYESTDDDLLPAGRYQAGQDIFIRGREGYFFPTETIDVIAEVAPIPLAEHEALYVRRLDTGAIRIVEGPVSYLPDPTCEQVVEREVDADVLALWGIPEHDESFAPSIHIPPSTAVMITAKNRREVVRGPITRILDWDEELEVLTLSTGRPKSDKTLLQACFLRIEGNKVSDVVRVLTADHVALEVTLSYRVSFAGDSARWFNVKDYVGLLCDHLASIIRAAARATPIDRFHAESAAVLHGAILGQRDEHGHREGRHFDENGMWVYDVEVLDARILDAGVEEMLSTAQRGAIASEVRRKEQELRLGDQRIKEAVDQQIYAARTSTLASAIAFETKNRDAELARAGTIAELERLEEVSRARGEADALQIREGARLEARERSAQVERAQLEAQSEAFRVQMEAVAPELIATLKLLGNQQLAGELSRNLSPLAILGGESVTDVVGRLLDRLPLGPGKTGREGVVSLFPTLAGDDESDREAS